MWRLYRSMVCVRVCLLPNVDKVARPTGLYPSLAQRAIDVSWREGQEDAKICFVPTDHRSVSRDSRRRTRRLYSTPPFLSCDQVGRYSRKNNNS